MPASLSPPATGVHAFCADPVGEDGDMSEQQQQSDGQGQGEQTADPRVVVVGPTGIAVEAPPGTDEVDERSVTEMVDQPAKVMRIGSMIKQLLEEVRNSELDEASRVRLKEIHTRSIKELEEGLAPELVAELERISLPFTDESIPSESELRVAQAQLVGWLEGLFHGIQTALFAQQMAARAQFEEMRRRALPPGVGGFPGSGGPGSGDDQHGPASNTGQYL
jgi:hypothetical protein